LSAPRPEGLSEFIQRISQTETLGVLTSNYGRLLIPDGIPLIHIDREFEVDVCPRYVVNSNGAQGITDLVNEFLEKGHRELAMIYSELPSSRVSSFIDVLQKAGISNAEKRIFCCPEKEKFSFHLLDTMFSHFPNLTGIITASDDLAFNVILNLRNRGIRVPEEISVAGFGNLPHICSLFDLTSVEQHGFEIGAFCANRLIDMIEKKYEAESFNELLPCELVRRQSIQPVRTVV
jgi:LacI family transcriptional regulator